MDKLLFFPLFCILQFARAQFPTFSLLDSCEDAVSYASYSNGACISYSSSSFNVTCLSNTQLTLSQYSDTDTTCTTVNRTDVISSDSCVFLPILNKYLNVTCNLAPIKCGNLSAPASSTVGCHDVYSTSTVTNVIPPYTTLITTTQVDTGRSCNITCNSGYMLNGSSASSCSHSAHLNWSNTFGTCVDRDECANVSLSKCPTNSVCQNTVGSFACRCYVGYKLNTTTNKCDTKAFKCPTDGSICGYFNLSIIFLPQGASSSWQTAFTNIVIYNFSGGADPSQFVISYKPIPKTGLTQVQIQISPYNTTNATTTDKSKMHDPQTTWMNIQTKAINSSTDKTSSFSVYLPHLSVVEINPPLVVTYHNLAFIGFPLIIIFAVLCALFGKKRKDDAGHGASPNVTTLPEAAPSQPPSPKPVHPAMEELRRPTRGMTEGVELPGVEV